MSDFDFAALVAENKGHLYLEGLRGLDISKMPKLQGVVGVDLTNTGVSDFRPLLVLESLNYLKFTVLKDTDLSFLSEFKHCGALAISGALKDLSLVPPIPGLRSLDISITDVEDISPASRFEALELLCVDDCLVHTLEVVRELKQLKNCWAGYTNATSAEPFREHPTLEAIVVPGNRFEDLTPFLTIPTLHTLAVDIGSEVCRNFNFKDAKTVQEFRGLISAA